MEIPANYKAKLQADWSVNYFARVNLAEYNFVLVVALDLEILQQ